MRGSVTTLVVLHGYDASAKTADELARELDPDGRYRHVVPEGCLTLPSGEHAWFDVDVPGSVATAARELGALVTALCEDGGIHPDTIALVGFSQGAAAAMAMLATGSGPTVGHVLGISGFVVDQEGVEYDWTRLEGVRVLLQHGDRDDVVPAFFSSDLATMLGEVGLDVVFQSFPIGHERSAASINAARQWLAQA